MKCSVWTAALAALALTCPAARASVILPEQTWLPFVGPSEGGSPFYAQVSLDGANLNVSYFLTGTGPFTSNPNSPGLSPGSTQYFGTPGFPLMATRPVTFPGGGPVTANLLLALAGGIGINELGWYDVNNPGVLNPLFLPNPTIPSEKTFTPPGEFGLYLTRPDGTYYSGDPDSSFHFAFFRGLDGELLYVGVEDLTYPPGEGGFGDYNDLVLSLRFPAAPQVDVATPEPTSLVVFGIAGLGALGYVRYRRGQVTS
jgi:hypothetical protein